MVADVIMEQHNRVEILGPMPSTVNLDVIHANTIDNLE